MPDVCVTQEDVPEGVTHELLSFGRHVGPSEGWACVNAKKGTEQRMLVRESRASCGVPGV